MNFSNLNIDQFLSTTAIAYMLLMIGILLLANLFLRESGPSKTSRK